MREVYTLLDEALGRVLEKAGDTTTTLVFLSHGMGPNAGGWQLLPEILFRLGYTPASPATVRIGRSLLPAPVKEAAKRFLRRGGATLLRSAAFRFLDPLESPRTRAMAERSEEHTSELQSRLHLVCRLLLEKKKKNSKINKQLNRH